MNDSPIDDLNDLLDAADSAGASLAQVCSRLALALEVPRLDIDRAVEAAVEAGRRLREAMSSAAARVHAERPSWTDRATLASLVQFLSTGLEHLAKIGERDRLLKLAHELRAGALVDSKSSRRERLERLRVDAVGELATAAEGDVPSLPWPSHPVESVVAWLAAEDGVSEQIMAVSPALAAFVDILDPSWWKAPLLVESAPCDESQEPEKADPLLRNNVVDSVGGGAKSDEAPSLMAPHRIDVVKARQAMQGVSVGGGLVWALPAPTQQVEELDLPHEGPRFVAAGALTPARLGPLEIELKFSRKDRVTRVAEPEGAPLNGEDVSPALEVAVTEAPSDEEGVYPDPQADVAVAEEPLIVPASEPAWSVPPPARKLPSELTSMAAFRAEFWRNEHGEVAPAPWRQPEFALKLEAAAGDALRSSRFGHLVLFARAAEALGVRSCPSAEDVVALVGLLGGPATAPRESEVRRARIDELVSDDVLRASLAARVAIFLEAVTQAPSLPLAASQGRAYAEAAGFSAPMIQLLEAFLIAGSAEDDPVGRLRAALQKLPKLSTEELDAAARRAASELHASIKTLWSAAGGRIGTAHSREAWQQFMGKAQPVFKDLVEDESWDDVRRLDGLLQDYTRIADKSEVRFGDRHRMDRAAADLVARARAVVTARREARKRQRAIQGRGLPELVEAFHRLSPRDTAAGSEASFAALLDRLLEHHTGAADESVGALSVPEILKRPALLECLPSLSLAEGRWIDASTIAEPLPAAAHLILDAEVGVEANVTLARHLRERGREDLLVHVEPRSDSDARFATDALGKAQATATRVLDEARAAGVALDELAHPAALDVRRALDEAERILGEGQVQEAPPQFLLAWIGRIREFARGALDESIPGLREAFMHRTPTPDEVSRFEHAVQQRRQSEMLALARGEGDAQIVDDRATEWRPAAAMEFSNPRRRLLDIPSRHAELCRLWILGVNGSGADDALRSAFVKFVFDTITLSKSNVRESRQRRETLVNMEPVRAAIAALGLNPSFIPQVTMFRDFSILTPSVAPSDSSFVRSSSELLAKASDGRIGVLLTPSISSAVREQLREELRRASRKGVGIIDDLDLVRLLNPGRQEPNPILGLLEIVLEQQPKWSPINPFETHEGQHTKPEMFVGRKEEADAISQRAQFSRVFSGRRLGKSALLKHVHDSQGNAKLPSGNRLRVVYVPIVGLDSEDAVVGKIIKAFRSFSTALPEPSAGAPAERLQSLVSSYLQREPKGSVLVFLDEADTFVEAQIKQYDKDREGTLTWRMRSEFEHEHDSRGLPRVRFVFAGYRATHRPEGAWANWGDVLRLRPLSRSDATRLIAGPLARLGISAGSEAAAIAYRCGYQPAIIVRFGQQLIEHLDATITPAKRECVVVTPEQVATVFQSPAVQQEIRTIVWNNFQGNRVGQVVFSALLLEFSRMPPGAALDDAPTRVLQKLRSLVPSLMADESVDGPAVHRIARTLRDFVDRSLIDEVHATTRSYRLRFPHQLHVLLQEDQEALIRREAAALDGESLDAIEGVRSLVPRGSLEDVAYAVANDGFVAGMIASHWLDGVELRAANVATRLGYFSREVVDLSVELGDSFNPSRRRLVLAKASPDIAARTLAHRTARGDDHPLLIGGIDLLRWGVRRRDVELATVSRLSSVQLGWWFERVCEINWAGRNPVRQFIEKTGGIPYLVARLDRELTDIVGRDGASASDAQIDVALDAYDRGLVRAARELVVGDQTIALERREAELFVMVAMASSVAREAPQDKQRSDLMDILVSPGDYAEIVPGIASYRGLAAGDAVALDVLQRCGLLISESRANFTDPFERLRAFPANDPSLRVAMLVGQCLST